LGKGKLSAAAKSRMGGGRITEVVSPALLFVYFSYSFAPSDWRHKILTPSLPPEKLIFLSLKIFILLLRYISADVLRTVGCK
jgi:hypothetical protein